MAMVIQTCVELDKSLYNAVKDYSKKDRRTIKSVIEMALEEFLEKKGIMVINETKEAASLLDGILANG